MPANYDEGRRESKPSGKIVTEELGFKSPSTRQLRSSLSQNTHIPTDDVAIKQEMMMKFVGVIFDQALTWTAYVDYIMDRGKVRLNNMRARVGSTWKASKSNLLIVYRAQTHQVRHRLRIHSVRQRGSDDGEAGSASWTVSEDLL